MQGKKAKPHKNKLDRYLEARSGSLKQKKKVQTDQESLYCDDLAVIQTCLDEQQSSAVVANLHRNNSAHPNQSHDSKVTLSGEAQCIACLEDHFLGGKYLLDCRHCLCNECFIYWSNISNKCPACIKKSNSVMIILEGCSRVKNLSPKYLHKDCQICGNNNNQFQMYYCDMCDHSCVHVYCEPKLMVEMEDEVWICKGCLKQKKMKMKGKSRNNFQYVDSEDQSSISEIDQFTFESGRDRNQIRQTQSEKKTGRVKKGKSKNKN